MKPHGSRQSVHVGAARPPWAVRLALAGISFVTLGAFLVVGVAVAGPLRNVDVLCAGVTLGLAGVVLRSIASPAEIQRPDAPPLAESEPTCQPLTPPS